MKVATLNVNSINARLNNLCAWLTENQPDVMLLQEIKCEFNNFPFFDLQMSGYEAKILGQKSYNGVAVLSRHPLEVKQENLPDFADENARFLECEFNSNGQKYVVASLYLPNGNPPQNNPTDDSRLMYKLQWMDALIKHADELLFKYKNVILGGDYNVMLTPQDVYNPELFAGTALYRPEVQKRIINLLNLGYCDAFRTLYPQQNGYTFWDYTGNSLQNDLGLRIDYILSSPALSDRLQKCSIDRDFRRLEKASDHTVLIAEFEDL